jgi:hypothetical protein
VTRNACLLQVCRHYNQGDVARLRHQLMTLPGEVDLLLTCEWPAGILQHLPAGQDNLPGKQGGCTVLCCAGVVSCILLAQVRRGA